VQRATTQDHGLSDRELGTIREVLTPFHASITSACLFGSRACGQFKPYSDIDLVLFGNMSTQAIARIHTLLDDSYLGLNVDVLAYQHIDYSPLKRHIDATAKQLFTQKQLNDSQPTKTRTYLDR